MKSRLPKRIRRRRWLLHRDRRNLFRRRKFKHKGPPPKRTLELNEHTTPSISTEHRRVSIELPAALDFEDNYETTASHFQAVRQAAKKQKLLRKLLFDRLRYISPSAALVLASEVDQIWLARTKRHHRVRIRTCTSSGSARSSSSLIRIARIANNAGAAHAAN